VFEDVIKLDSILYAMEAKLESDKLKEKIPSSTFEMLELIYAARVLTNKLYKEHTTKQTEVLDDI
jgi:hypothetical protein